MNSRNISAMLLSCKEKANTRKLHLKQQPLLSRVDMGWEPRRIGGGGGEGYGSQERRREKEEVKELKGKQGMGGKRLGSPLSKRFNTKHWGASRNFG